MKPFCIFTLYAVCLISACAQDGVTIGSRYDIALDTELRAGPSQNHERIINQKASDVLKEIHYLTVDSSTTVKVTEINGSWVKIEVVEPEYLAESHRGWIPLKCIKVGDATRKMEGWMKHTSLVYGARDTKSKAIGYIVQSASVGVAADGSGWLRLIHGPLRDIVTKKFLPQSQTPEDLYIEEKNFSAEVPAK